MNKSMNNVPTRKIYEKNYLKIMTEDIKKMTELPKPVFDKTPGSQRELKQDESGTSKSTPNSETTSPVYDET